MPLPSGLPENVSDEEFLARFLTSSGHFNSLGAKHAAFMPSAKDGKTSVFRHGHEPSEALQAIGKQHVAGERRLFGAAMITAAEVRAVSLELKACEPPDRHADIVRWPWRAEDPDFAKGERKLLAMALAQKSETSWFK